MPWPFVKKWIISCQFLTDSLHGLEIWKTLKQSLFVLVICKVESISFDGNTYWHSHTDTRYNVLNINVKPVNLSECCYGATLQFLTENSAPSGHRTD